MKTIEERIFALPVTHNEQEPHITKHCFGDCGKISFGGAVITQIWPTMLCFVQKCPYEVNEMDEPLGAINNPDIEEHGKDIYLRVFVTDEMRKRLALPIAKDGE